nr:gastric triacylglycerol lipase-like [Pogona vitticeps]
MWLGPVLICFLCGSELVEGAILHGKVNIEATLNAVELIEYWGYPCELYKITTDDGYILTMFRIPHGRVNEVSRNTSAKPVVFLQHGLLVDAVCWYQNLPNANLPFMLADAGYDVWLGNSRGTTWSKQHNFLAPNSVEFWEFSFDEMAKYDLPASIDFVLQKTGQQQVTYIGHSQGTTIAFIAFSTNLQLAAKIKLFIALAPVVTVKHATTPLAKLSIIPDFQIKLLFGNKDFLPETNIGATVRSTLCSQDILAPICSNLLFIICGFNENNLNMSRLDVYSAHAPAGTSVQNIIHWKQAVRSGKFQAFDYGWRDNQAIYNQPAPPEYDLTAMTVPTVVWSGGNDWLSDPTDVAAAVPQIKNLISHVRIPEWNHLDFVFGQDAPEKLYYNILNLLKE